MNIRDLENHFGSYLTKSWKLGDVTPFILVYIRLLLLFKSELPEAVLSVVLERQKQLLGKEFTDSGFDELKNSSRKDMERAASSDTSGTRKASLNRMLFCALLDTEEVDFFHLTEPMFEFAEQMEVSSGELRKILESEFVGFNSEQRLG